MVQWLRLSIPNVEGVGSIPGQGTKTPCGKEKKNWGHRKTLCQEPHRILLGFNRIRYANPQICHFGKKTFKPEAAEKQQTQEELSALLICLKAGCSDTFPL